MKKTEREKLLDEINNTYYDHTDMTSVKPDVPLQKMNVLGQRYKRHQSYGFGFEYGHGVGGNIRIPVYCDYCKDGDLEDEPEYIIQNCRMSQPKFSAIRNGDYDTIGWHSTCPNCRAQTWQVVDVPYPYDYDPEAAQWMSVELEHDMTATVTYQPAQRKPFWGFSFSWDDEPPPNVQACMFGGQDALETIWGGIKRYDLPMPTDNEMRKQYEAWLAR